MIERIVALRHRFPAFWSGRSFAFACSRTRRNWIGRRFRRDRRYSDARRVGREGSAATSTDRLGRASTASVLSVEQRVVRGFRRLVPLRATGGDRSVEADERQREAAICWRYRSSARPTTMKRSDLASSAAQDSRNFIVHPLGQRPRRSDRRAPERAFATVDMVAEAGRRAAFRPASGFACQDNERHERMHRKPVERSTQHAAACARANSSSASTGFASTSTRSVRTRRWSRGRRRESGARPRGRCPPGSTTPGTTPITRSDASTTPARSDGVSEHIHRRGPGHGQVVGLASTTRAITSCVCSHHDLGMIDPKGNLLAALRGGASKRRLKT